ncbi:hypothetical protein GO986_21970 [Deinococcus sp. HMF7620]|uniref:Uncharacterized protein n=1 Tax=Deinococcus arboris TaxID=2682977 RepID=A0A7C9MTZ4_9DEIO|nr:MULTISPECIES: hypothetical protein [Deinococcus]MBZ9752837.1 hypothetical protein [Deinococcus betulae]MVN89404.1 hypothetical protein [Deinococcus arboris]
MKWHWLPAGARHARLADGDTADTAWTLEEIMGEADASAPELDLVWLIGGNGAVGLAQGNVYFRPHRPGVAPNGVDRALADRLARRAECLHKG